jgi:hypothetical protein
MKLHEQNLYRNCAAEPAPASLSIRKKYDTKKEAGPAMTPASWLERQGAKIELGCGMSVTLKHKFGG